MTQISLLCVQLNTLDQMMDKSVFLLISTLFLSIISKINGQELSANKTEWNRNSIQANVGFAGYFAATGYYERILSQKKKYRSFMKVGVGIYALPGSGEGGNYILAHYGILTGMNKHHLELGAGPNWFLEGEWEGIVPFTATIGYRNQRPDNHNMFRVGISWPDAVYMGMGISF